MKRDKTLDLIRGAAVLHVLLIHILYFLDIFGTGLPALLRSFLLFEMPIFFLVTGAVNCLGERRALGTFYLRRVKGLMLPYYGYAALCVLMTAIVELYRHSFSAEELLRTALSWLLPLDHQVMPLPFFTWAVWFVPVYLLVILLFPLVRRISETFGGMAATAGFALLFLIAEEIGGMPDILQKTCFYLIFTALGTQWQTLKRREKKHITGAAVILAVSIAGLFVCRSMPGGSWDMQANKFPPNRMFLFFSFAALSGLYLILPALAGIWRAVVCRVSAAEKIVLLYSTYSVYVFLGQSFAFLIALRIRDRIGAGNGLTGFFVTAFVVYSLVTAALLAAERIRKGKKKENLRKP